MESLFVVLLVVGVIGFFVVILARTSTVMTHGIETKALVVSAKPAGGTSGAESKIAFTLEFTDPGTKTSHRVVFIDAISQIHAPKAQPGMFVPIKFLRKDPKRIIWNFQ